MPAPNLLFAGYGGRADCCQVVGIPKTLSLAFQNQVVLESALPRRLGLTNQQVGRWSLEGFLERHHRPVGYLEGSMSQISYFHASL